MIDLSSLALAAVIAAQAPQSPPIFNPGAPGAPARVISADQAVAMSRGSHTEADIAFMRHMLVHHAQAVEMVELLRLHGQDETVKLLGERIALTQAAEMEVMSEWLAGRGLATVDPHLGHHMHAGMDHSQHGAAAPDETAIMPGMLSPAQMRRLAEARGAAFDKLFLEGMIQHHQGAIDMVDALLETPRAAEDVVLSEFANAVVADQSAEIRRMQSILSNL